MEQLPSLVLIETLWNVKTAIASIYSAKRVVLIETLWNVKYCSLHPG